MPRKYISEAQRIFYIEILDTASIPKFVEDYYAADKSKGNVYSVKLNNADGDIYFYVTPRLYENRREVHLFFANGKAHYSYTKSINTAIEMGCADGWLFIERNVA